MAINTWRYVFIYHKSYMHSITESDSYTELVFIKRYILEEHVYSKHISAKLFSIPLICVYASACVSSFFL